MRWLLPSMLLACGPKATLAITADAPPPLVLDRLDGCGLYGPTGRTAEVHVGGEGEDATLVSVFAEPDNPFYEVFLLHEGVEYLSNEPFVWTPEVRGGKLSARVEAVLRSEAGASRRVVLDLRVGHCDRR